MLSILRFDPIIIVIFFGMCAFDPYFVYLKMCTKTLCITCYNRRQFFSSLWPFVRIWFINKLSPLLSHFVFFFCFCQIIYCRPAYCGWTFNGHTNADKEFVNISRRSQCTFILFWNLRKDLLFNRSKEPF